MKLKVSSILIFNKKYTGKQIRLKQESCEF